MTKLEYTCKCGCERFIKDSRIFYSPECRDLWLKMNPFFSKVIAYIELEETDIIEVGDRVGSEDGPAFTRSSGGVGKVCEEWIDSPVYRPLIVKALDKR